MSGISSLHNPLPQNLSLFDSKKDGQSGGKGGTSASGMERVDQIELSRSLIDDVARKTKEFSDVLVGELAGAEIGLRDIRTLKESFSITLKDDRITATGPYKDQIEAFLRDNPDKAKRIKDELKEILALNALIALKEANERYRQDKKKAEAISDPVKRDEALKKVEMRNLERTERLSDLSGTMIYRHGEFVPAGLDYIRSLPA